MQALTEADLRSVFRTSELHLPELSHVDWGVLDYFGWIHPAGHAGYVIMPVQDALVGMRLKRMINHDHEKAVMLHGSWMESFA